LPDYIGNIPVPEITPSGTFPLVPDYPLEVRRDHEVVVHPFGSGNAKIEQRLLLGTGARRFTVRKQWLRDADRIALRNFWETKYGPYGAFTFNAPNDNGVGTTPVTCRFANEPLSWEMVADWACSIGVTLVEIPAGNPSYPLSQTVNRFPPAALQTALLSQVQEIIPLVKIQPLQPSYPAIYLSDRRCTIGGQLYQARLVEFEGISQSLGGESDEAQFTFGNADRVMRDLANDVDLYRAAVQFSLYHVGTGIKLDLWQGHVVNWSCDQGPEFHLIAADGLYELNLPYPTRKISRTCWKQFKDGVSCPYSGPDTSCDKGFDTPSGCRAHGMDNYFGGILAKPQSVRIKDNSTGTWGFRRSTITSASLVSESIYDQVVPEIYTDSAMPVNCKIAMGREESDFYAAVGIVGEGPIGAFGTGHTLDNQLHHGPGDLGLYLNAGPDPNPTTFGFDTDNAPERAAGTAFLMIRRMDEKGFQLSKLEEHSMQAIINQGLGGWAWSGVGQRAWRNGLTNPIWIAVNMLLRARGLRFASASVCEQYFDVEAAVEAAAICDQTVTSLFPRKIKVWVEDAPGYYDEQGQWHEPEGHYEWQEINQETQFKFRGVLQEEKPLRDWLQEVLANCLGYYTFANGALKLGVRVNSSTVEAFTEGNILFRSLQLAPLKPGFNHLTANFADEEFDFAGNSISLYDADHAALLGGGAGPLYLKANLNLSGTASKSQAARILTTRLREELGGITAEEWKKARQISFRTTVLALNTEPGMVCSLTHPDMPGGSGEFRVTGWRLNKDYSIDIEGRTTTDSMYDLAIGPKPADVPPSEVPVEPGYSQAPHVKVFRAGRLQQDGQFAPEMYWDDRRQRMLIDWACLAPEDRTNWSGVQVWIKSPRTGGGYAYTPATDPIPQTQFTLPRRVEGGEQQVPYLYDTIAIEPESIPQPPQTWTLICASISRFGTLNRDSEGNPFGPTVELMTLPRADYVSNFAAEAVYEITESGDQQFRLRGSWTNPTTPRYKGVRILMRGWESADITVADAPEGASSFASQSWPVPQAAKNITVYAVPVYGDGTVGTVVPGSTPSVALTIQRLTGDAGREYADLVTGFTAAVASPAYAVNGQGQRVLRVNLSWSNPSDPRFGGVALYVNWIDGRTYQLASFERGTSFAWETTNFPSSAANATFYARSVDTNNRVNSYVGGVTPAQTIQIPAPTSDNAPAEWCAHVTGFNASVSYPATADGTARAVVTCTFTPPNDPRWGGVSIRTTTDFAVYIGRVEGSRSPLTFELPVGITPTTFYVAAVSFDVNGRMNTPAVGAGTPWQSIIVGNAAGQLDLSRARPTSYDPDIFTIQDGRFKVWQFNGSLIVAGTVSSDKLATNEIMVGGGGNKPGKFGVYNALGQQIGFIGVEGTNEGAWFKTARIGGTSYSNAPLIADVNGNVSLNDATIQASGSWTDSFGVNRSQTFSVTPASTQIVVLTETSASIDASKRSRTVLGSGGIDIRAADGGSYPRLLLTRGHNPGGGGGLIPEVLLANLLVDAGQNSSGQFAQFFVQASRYPVTGVTGCSLSIWSSVPGQVSEFRIDATAGQLATMSVKNMNVTVDDSPAFTGTVQVKKPDDTTATLTFKRGWLVGVS